MGLNVKISLANIDHMENVVKIIISLCIDFSIKTENIHENMLAMGAYIRDFQKAKEKVEETKTENARLEKEIAQLNTQIDSLRKLYNSYKDVANANVMSKTVKGSELVERMVEMEEEKKKLKLYAESMELKYSQAFGRKNEYKDSCKELERKFTQYKNETNETIKKCKEELTQYKKETDETIKKCKEDTEMEKNIKLKLMIDNHQVGKFAEELEQKNDNLMKEYQVLRKTHEEENRIMKMNHENDIKRERSMISEVTLKVQTLEGDVKKAREWYTRKMKDTD